MLSDKDFISKLCSQVGVPNYGMRMSVSCKSYLLQGCREFNAKEYTVESSTDSNSAYQIAFNEMINSFNYCSVTPSLEKMHNVKSCYYQQVVTILNVNASCTKIYNEDAYIGTTGSIVKSASINTINISLPGDDIISNPSSHWEANKNCLKWACTDNAMLYENGKCTKNYGKATLYSASKLFDGCLRLYFGFCSGIDSSTSNPTANPSAYTKDHQIASLTQEIEKYKEALQTTETLEKDKNDSDDRATTAEERVLELETQLERIQEFYEDLLTAKDNELENTVRYVGHYEDHHPGQE